ncbi:protein phosphatase 1 regulatory subunit 15B-like [Seriola lalandi dorsalis]|uniref:protein phosphatase 1 regulatory subunit 15B-like n=1 Tax=Seriola lalandi dorsalis TaxID=1841481 RepID=UPI000C6F93C0|nr:protein phosphatase 1 regulatory subunit 15B-like [Seriola lalandi dorsalis]XP_056258129.1 protein phosphatase 1 regulatory subunit 15B [Seriola aureovittata]
MFRNMSDGGHFSGGQSSSSPTGHGVTSVGLDNQESSWIGLLSVVSRPAMSFLQKYLPGRTRNPTMSDRGTGWINGDLKGSFVDEEREFLRQLDDMMPLTQHAAPHLTYLRCQHNGAAGLLEPRDGSTLPWLTADSLREIGVQNAEMDFGQESQIGYFSSARTFFSHVMLSSVSSQEIKPTGGKDWVSEAMSSTVKSSGGKSRTWWGSFWGGEESSQKGLLSDLSWAEEGTVTGQLCPQQPGAETKAPAAETTDVFVQRDGRESTLGENTGPTDHKEEPANNGGLHTVQNTEGSTPDHQLNISNHLSSSGAAAACSEVALLTPDQDNGYSSLEEEHFQMCHLHMVKAPIEEHQETEPTENCATVNTTEMEEESSEEGESTSEKLDKEENTQHSAPQECQSAGATEHSTPQCPNKAIAFIMGCPCSDDDDSSQSDRESSDDDDDGFDSEGSSDLSDTTDEDDEDDDEGSDSDSEGDSETERLWSSLCQSVDPYNPQNFTAQLHTGRTQPRTIPTSTPPSSTQSTPASSPDLTPLPLSSLAASPPLNSFSPSSGHDVWDDSTSASEVDEAESLRLWSSFSSSSDPYSPFNFQAPLRTRGPVEAAPRARAKKASQTPLHSTHHKAASPPEYSKQDAEERLDSGFSEPSTSFGSSTTRSCGTTKKVRFCDNVEEFFASCGEEEEDRRGPWEELARDRCRFLRRCQEVEQSIAYCLQPQHRSLVYHRLTTVYVQDA